MTDDRENLTVIVTGGNRGIGKSIVMKLSESGYDIIFTYNTGTEEAASTEEAVRKFGVKVKGYQVDLTSRTRIEDFSRQVKKSGQRIFAIVNNAGIYKGETIDEITDEDWEKTINLNLSAPFYLTRNLHSIIMDNGSIVNISSVYGFRADPWAHGYQASKAAIIHLTRGLAKELAPRIRVNCVAPGYIRTDMNKEGWESVTFYNKIKKITPMSRWGEPEDIANAIKFLIDPANSFITGETLVVDGGIGL